MDPRIPESASVAMFSEAHNFSLHGPDFRAAGRDMHVQTCNSTFNLNIDTGPFHSSISETSSSSSQKLFTFEGLMSRIMTSFVDESLRGQDPGHPHSAGTASTPETAPSPKAKAQVHHEGDVAVIVLEKPEEKFTLIGDLTTPEIYVSNMLGTGKGLACWQPRPRKPYAGETGAIPGDVGTYSAEGGFKKIFNLWDDEVALANKANELYQTTYRAPERNVFIDESEMQQDETIVSGASSDILYMNDGRAPVGFEFRCRSQHGAIAIPTSSAELEEVVDCMALRDTIIQNNALFYQYANGIRTIGDEEALYILTGCIKSESWALAAYREPMSPPHDLLRLIKGIDSPGHGSSHSSPSQYTWTNRGTSAARLGGSEVAGIKDQSLFLRGFKLDFSQKFRTQMKSQPWKLPVTTSPIGGAQGGSSFKTSLDSSNSRQRVSFTKPQSSKVTI
ncbi:hypothetical protein D9611_001239 [Ephemerocybe angulata]|uniref:Uncharacterized protein n=1 Tax=Ephemerocybe angulata TaxID=980116 RepID=A0A8H5FMC2_9AGAR|nr:hypothetical protein D9611_001239 [Tulosesus angulatus]